MADALRLPPLPALSTPLAELKETFRGPTRRSNWVVPGIIMAGNRAGLDTDDGARAILGSGITMVVCLQSRQEMASSVPYRRRVEAISPGVAFHEQPIPDQGVVDDGLVELLLEELLGHLSRGKVLYVHCKGGHGRTGTVTALLLGKLYGLSAKEAMVRVQFYHDTRVNPVFTAEGYSLLGDGSSCEVLFPVQQQQVFRLLSGDSTGAPAGVTAAAEPPAPTGLERAKSSVYGPGASKYGLEELEQWQAAAAEATSALNLAAAVRREKGAAGDAERKEALKTAVGLYRRAATLRPDFERGWLGLARALKFLGQADGARTELLKGLDFCPGEASLMEELAKLGQAPSSSSSVPAGGGGAVAAEPPTLAAGDSADARALGEAARAAERAPAPAPGMAAGAAVPAPAPTWRPRTARPGMVLLVGLPGSGKSTFAKQLEKSGRSWVRICQDEMPGRSAVEDALGRLAKDAQNQVILDRCNERSKDRKAFLELAFHPKDAVCVHFDASAAECEERVAKRTDHPTIKFGGGRNAVRSKHEDFEVPRREEGFAEVITVGSFQDADHLLSCWGAEPPEVVPVGFFKFPTTPHVLDLTNGRILAESDRLLQPFEAARFFDGRTTVIVEEKVDGANCGISLTKDYEPLYQNRAHYVTSTTATQWQAIDAWWDKHGGAVCQLLEPEVEVLFGEWVWARHSRAYTKLPGYFVAFDIYNKREGRFCSARERDRRLEGLGIPVVPRLAERSFRGEAELLALLQRPSSYADGPMEGIYLRIDEPEEMNGGLWLQHRGKIVKADFVQGITTHWIHRDVERNQLEF